jgi:hypothetical protein
MTVREIYASLQTLTPTELFEVKKTVEELCAPLSEELSGMKREERIAKAKQEIFTEYDSLLRDLAK